MCSGNIWMHAVIFLIYFYVNRQLLFGACCELIKCAFRFSYFFYIEYYRSTIGCSSSVVLGVTWIFMSNAVQGHFIFMFDFVVFQTLRHTPLVNIHHTIWKKSNPTDLVGKCDIHMHKGWKHSRKH
uniref:Uncharacterized protein n=1 Tax=Ixodes ricinus TaxID=34613 RepID=A0A6B0UQS3_IXORI